MTRVPALIRVLLPDPGGAGQAAWVRPSLHRQRMRVDDMSGEAVISPTAGSQDARGRVAASARVGMFAPFDLLERGSGTARAFLARVAEAGSDHVCCGGHVRFSGASVPGLLPAPAPAMLP